MKKVTGATKAKLSQYAKGRVRGKNGRFAMEFESDRQQDQRSWEFAIGVAILVTLVVVLSLAGK